jgi:hypothetical protein
LDLTLPKTGKLFGDKGYLSQKLFEDLHSKGIELITKLKNRLISLKDKLLLRKRAIIETINDQFCKITACQYSATGTVKYLNWLRITT